MVVRRHVWLTAGVSGGAALLTTSSVLERWRWPLDAAWAGVAVLLLAPVVVGYALLRQDTPNAEYLHRACVRLMAAVYAAITTSMLLLLEALSRTR